MIFYVKLLCSIYLSIQPALLFQSETANFAYNSKLVELQCVLVNKILEISQLA